MQIAILGGTGALGGGLALRLAHDTDHELSIGSRDPERAADAAASYRETLADRGVNSRIESGANPDAAAGAAVVVAAVPATYVADTIETVADRLHEDAIVVSPAVGIDAHAHGFDAAQPAPGSVTATAADAAPASNPVVGAFHTLAAGRLSDLDAALEIDALVVGDDPDARDRIAALVEEIEGLRALDVGPLANAHGVECLTALQLTLMRQNSALEDVGVRFR
ncbi:NADPH-dependent F420 reductase [Salinarchaeum sp. Harcht-Bsk1]|uniref:NADPH-dependent F420 reductase n=1 Tax=Salinarchaeum sp. Harcht-Bsk1 TaxID=1333523 RepID=UPI0003422C4C|nr:NADPH-dependent F420 reductase [Salinarchaeum sp. Harcht-Bsk1]AGN02728.1 NADPH-dependent F420 reductase [Salinarchaeum sp. Harcht-Bsk1]